MSVNLQQISKIKHLREVGMLAPQIAIELSVPVSTVRDTLLGRNGLEQRRIADRAEYFFGGIVSTGCTVTRITDSESVTNVTNLTSTVDTTLEEAAFIEFLEVLVEECKLFENK